jgi:hypothetical protein
MRAFAEAWSGPESIVQTLSGQLSWSHNVALLNKLDDHELRACSPISAPPECSRSSTNSSRSTSSVTSAMLGKIKDNYGATSIGLGRAGMIAPPDWTMARKHSSPRYTDWEELLLVKAG